MSKPTLVRFSVRPEDEDAAMAHFQLRGHRPNKIEREDAGLVVLSFALHSDDEMSQWVMAVPHHLSARRAIVAGSQEAFEQLTRNGR